MIPGAVHLRAHTGDGNRPAYGARAAASPPARCLRVIGSIHHLQRHATYHSVTSESTMSAMPDSGGAWSRRPCKVRASRGIVFSPEKSFSTAGSLLLCGPRLLFPGAQSQSLQQPGRGGIVSRSPALPVADHPGIRIARARNVMTLSISCRAPGPGLVRPAAVVRLSSAMHLTVPGSTSSTRNH